MPDNIKALGQIRLLFPNARIIICRRDPRDVCVSCFTTHFGGGLNWSWNLEDCARQTIEIERLLELWRAVLPGPVLEISYEALVADMETESRRLIAFLGLALGSRLSGVCEDKTERDGDHRRARYRSGKPVYNSSIGKWRRYEAHLGPMLRILAAARFRINMRSAWRWDSPEGVKALAARDGGDGDPGP